MEHNRQELKRHPPLQHKELNDYNSSNVNISCIFFPINTRKRKVIYLVKVHLGEETYRYWYGELDRATDWYNNFKSYADKTQLLMGIDGDKENTFQVLLDWTPDRLEVDYGILH